MAKFLLKSFLSVLWVATAGAVFAQKITFDSRWTWEYRNDWIADGKPGRSGEISVYHHSASGAWLFTEEAYGSSGATLDFIIGTPDGKFTVAYRDVNGRKRRQVQDVPELRLARTQTALILRQFAENYRKSGEKRGFKESGFEGTEYLLLSQGEEKTIRYLAVTPVDFGPVVYFSYRNGEAELPYYFPTDVPPGYVLLEDETISADGKKIHLRLKSKTDVKHRISLKAYQ